MIDNDYKVKLSKLEKNLGVEFSDKNLLAQALTHRSYLNEHPEFSLGHNERLEFLGDAVLELVVTEFLYSQYPDKTEGELTNWRAALVNSSSLMEVARSLQLEDLLLLSRGEAQDTGKARQFILANAFEALLGALYLDQGWEGSKQVIQTRVISLLPQILSAKSYLDPKTKLQEIIQDKHGLTPFYKVLKESGPDHVKEFEVGVYVGDTLAGQGKGLSKQEAQVEAARQALQFYHYE